MLHAQGRDGSAAGVECKNGFRQTRGWVGDTTSLLPGLTATSVVLNEILGAATTARALRCGEGLLGGRANS